MSKLLDQLLRPELPHVLRDLPTKDVEVIRLSKLLDEPVVFTLQGLPYGRIAELQRKTEDLPLHILLAGCPDLRDPALLTRPGCGKPAATAGDAVKDLLLPGEIEDLSRQVEKLSGYRMNTIREVKKG